jgi:Domain of unknown function (DUF4412)
VRSRPILIAALLLATAVPAARAATLLTYQEKDPANPGQVTERRVVLDGPRLRMDTSGSAAGDRVLIYSADSGIFYILDDAKHSYTELQRAEVPIPANPSPTMVAPDGTAYKKTDSGFIVNGFRSDKYVGTKNGRKVEELYVADPKALGLAAEDLKTLHTMAETFAEKGQHHTRLSLTAEVPGVSVRMVRFEGGKPAMQIDLTAVRKEEVPAATFELPAGYTRLAQGMANGG